MGRRASYTPGTFSWTDLTTTDQDAAKRFYGELFGWTSVDNPVGDGIVYSMMQLDGADVGAISPQPEQQRDAGVPPTWNSYITVENADAALERAEQLGGGVHAEAFDVMEAGRMGVVQDPQGAFFLVWEPKDHIGAALVNAPGALSWNELATPDIEASARFYSDLFGWTTELISKSPMPYMTIKTRAGRPNGGIRPVMGPEPPYWAVYFGTDDLDATTDKVSDLGGEKLAGPMELGPSRFSYVRDPQGAVFALYSGDFDE
jgi:predicted enzyme related to lactoylglutathione lyase